ncbi:MAG TPA: hypothetical protein VFH35_06760 [Ramlibacter sp.]|nr:hypothetical protein [Ramlibacter sp.]
MAKMLVRPDELMAAMDSIEDSLSYVADLAEGLAVLAHKLGVTLRIDVQQDPTKPLAMGNTRPVIQAWPARHGVPKDPR